MSLVLINFARATDAVVCRGERTRRRPRASKARGHPKSEITKFKCCN